MFILPYSTELRLNTRPYIVYSIILLCFIIFHFQNKNEKQIGSIFSEFCADIYQPDLKIDENDKYRNSRNLCMYYVERLHRHSKLDDWVNHNLSFLRLEYTQEELERYGIYNVEYYGNLKSENIPENLNKKLMYYPDTFNPFKMLTSALSHGSWSHIIFNLIFFFAFAPALEILSRSKVKFVILLMSIEFVCGILYSLISIMKGTNIPTLGLSGTVMGMIGFSAYMMPWARIRTLFWFFTFLKTFHIPAWILASWYIGWDTYDLFSRTNNGGINVLAHVAGGLSGYFMGVCFFRKEKILAQYELELEINHMYSKRTSISNVADSYNGDKAYIDSKQQEHEAKKAYGRFNEKLYKYIKVGETAEALSLLIGKYDLFQDSPELYIELFNDIGEWKKKRVYLCTGRLIIDLLVEKKKYADIPYILTACIDVDERFVLSDPTDLLCVANYLVTVHQYNLAIQLIHQATIKYGETINFCDCILLEAQILWSYLSRTEDAKMVINESLKVMSNNDKHKAVNFLKVITKL